MLVKLRVLKLTKEFDKKYLVLMRCPDKFFFKINDDDYFLIFLNKDDLL